MTDYRGSNAFSKGLFKPAKVPTIIAPYQRAPSGVVRQADGPAFDNRFPKSRYPRGGGQSGLRPVLEVAGGGGDYVAKAVQFPVSSGLLQVSSALADNSKLMIAGSFNIADISNFPNLLICQVTTGFTQTTVTLAIGYRANSDFTVVVTNHDSTKYFQFGSADGLVQINRWNEFATSIDTNHSAGHKIGQLIYNGVDVVADVDDTATAFDIGWNTAETFFNNAGFSPATCNWGDFQGWVGAQADISNPTNYAKFFDGSGNMVDPTIAATAFGPQTFLFSGDTSGYPVNQGSGGSFTLVGGPLSDVPPPP